MPGDRPPWRGCASGRSLATLFAHLTEWAATNLEHVDQARRHYDAAGHPHG